MVTAGTGGHATYQDLWAMDYVEFRWHMRMLENRLKAEAERNRSKAGVTNLSQFGG